MNELEKAVEADLDMEEEFHAGPRPKLVLTKGSVAEQMLGVAETIRNIHREIDALETDFGARLNALRKQLGGKA